MYVLIVVVFLAGDVPFLALHDFAKQERCENAGKLIEVMVREGFSTNTGAQVLWQCMPKQESAVG